MKEPVTIDVIWPKVVAIMCNDSMPSFRFDQQVKDVQGKAIDINLAEIHI